jgi:hypothetical protein
MNMGRGMKWTWALALGLGVGAAALARADDDEVKPAKTGNWFTRLFARDRAKKVDAKKGDLDAPAPPSPALVRQKALAELMRRQEVCQKLKEIALQTGDTDLSRKAEALDQRAYDVYLLRTGGSKGNLSPDEQILEGRLGLEAAQRSRKPAAGGSASASVDGRAAVRKD